MIENAGKRIENSGIQCVIITMTRIDAKTLLRTLTLWNSDQD